MAFQTSHRNYALATSATSGFMILPADQQATYLIYNPATTVQYYAFGVDGSLTLSEATPAASGATAVAAIGTPIAPGQQVLINRNLTTNPVYFYGLSPSGASFLRVSMGSGE